MFKHTTYAVTLAAIFCISIEAQASPISPGDVIAVDFAGAATHDAGGWGSTGAADAPNFNIFDSNTTITSGSVIRHSDNTVVDGVSITFGGASGFNNDPRGGDWPGTAADPYYVSAADDLAFRSGSTTAAMTLTFDGLDASLLYNVRVYSFFNDDTRWNRAHTFTVTNGTGFESINNTQGDRWFAATLEAAGTVFSSVSTNGSSQIVVSMVPTNNSNPTWNAIVLEAVPEPGTLALCVMGLFGLAAGTWRKRRAR